MIDSSAVATGARRRHEKMVEANQPTQMTTITLHPNTTDG